MLPSLRGSSPGRPAACQPRTTRLEGRLFRAGPRRPGSVGIWRPDVSSKRSRQQARTCSCSMTDRQPGFRRPRTSRAIPRAARRRCRHRLAPRPPRTGGADRRVQRINPRWVTTQGGGHRLQRARRERDRESAERAYGHYAGERARIREQAQRGGQWEERGYGQGRKKRKGKDTAKAFEKKLARLDTVEKPWRPWQLRLELAPVRRGGDVVARLEQAVVRARSVPARADRPRIATASSAETAPTGQRSCAHSYQSAARRRQALDHAPSALIGELPQGEGPFSNAHPLLATFCAESSLPAGDNRGLLAKFALGPRRCRAARPLALPRRTQPSLARTPRRPRRQRARPR